MPVATTRSSISNTTTSAPRSTSYASLDDATLDARVPDAMTLRELAHHAAESIDYATMIGTL